MPSKCECRGCIKAMDQPYCVMSVQQAKRMSLKTENICLNPIFAPFLNTYIGLPCNP